MLKLRVEVRYPNGELIDIVIGNPLEVSRKLAEAIETEFEYVSDTNEDTDWEGITVSDIQKAFSDRDYRFIA